MTTLPDQTATLPDHMERYVLQWRGSFAKNVFLYEKDFFAPFGAAVEKNTTLKM